MVTVRQMRAAAQIIEKRGAVSISAVMRDVGYSENSAHNPSNLTESQGYKEALAEFGLTEGFITKALVSDIKKKPKKRARELALAADILGMTKRDAGSNNKTLIVVVSGQSAGRYGINTGPGNNSQ